MAELDNIRAIFDHTREELEGFAKFSVDLRKSCQHYIQEVKKKIKKTGAFVEPPVTLPVLCASFRTSASASTVIETPPGTKPGGRPARGAALRARQGVNASYEFMKQGKLRRPSNFNTAKGFNPLPTIPATPAELSGGSSSSIPHYPAPASVASSDEGIFRVPAPPMCVPGPSRTNPPPSPRSVTTDDSEPESAVVRKSKRIRASKRKNTKKDSQGVAASRTVILDAGAPEPMDTTVEGEPPTETSVMVPPTDSNITCVIENDDNASKRTRTRTIRKNKPETSIMVPPTDSNMTCVIESDDNASKRTRTRTIRKNKPENSEAVADAVEIPDTDSDPNRTKTINNKPEATSAMVLSEINTDALEIADTNSGRTRTKTIHKNKPEATSPMDLSEINTDALEIADTNSGRTRTKTIRKNKPEATSPMVLSEINTDAVEIVDTNSDRTRTKTIRKNKPEATSPVVLSEINTDPAVDADSGRTRTKTIRKNKPEATSPMVLSDADENCGANRTRTKTIRKNKPVKENINPTEVVDLENPASKTDEGMAVSNDQPEIPSRKSDACPKSTIKPVVPAIEIVDMDDPMASLASSVAMECFTVGGSNKRSHESRNVLEEVQGVKRHKPSDPTVDDIVINQNAPRTRSKMRAVTEPKVEETTRTPGQVSKVPVDFIMQGFSAGARHTPASTNKLLMSPKVKTGGSASGQKPTRFYKDPNRETEKTKMAEARKKEEEALRKKQELMKLKQEEIRNQREKKVKKVTESRAAVTKEKLLLLEKEKKEREEKMAAARAEVMKQKEQERLKKKLQNDLKAQEAEERRRKDEQLRLAKLRELEEEQRKAAEARQRQLEEAERLAALRKQQQKEEEQARLLEKMREKQRLAKAAREETFDPDDFGIQDDDADDVAPRRPIPKWAEKEARMTQLRIQNKVNPSLIRTFFNVEPLPPNLREIFGSTALIRPRTSSAVWVTPPPSQRPPPSST
ncbi:hypothetical protein GE061_014210 [Apolygus lucorum]|uniref:Inner centromere protein ARK-binding domain-containing protein n=1 Tax=Apolygus lucorum TaxID=248454 RepID=A0A8S9XSN2_APOLU|nr:hypothetical protein GE061_014210 [Apolygus lucorum]